MDKGIEYVGYISKFLVIIATVNKIAATTVEAQNTLIASFVPVCRTIPLKEPTITNPNKIANQLKVIAE